MARYISLNKDEHGQQGWVTSGDMLYARGDMTVPLLIEEVAHVLTTMPIVFVRKQDHEPASTDTEQFEMHALMSLEPGNNLFVSRDGQWLTGYVPAAYRAFPFKALLRPGSKERAVCFNLDSGLLVQKPLKDDERFFSDDGEPTGKLAEIISFLQKCEKNRQVTQAGVDALARHGLITALRIRINIEGQEPKPIEGLFIINEPALRKLSADALFDLHKNNALAIAFAQLYSQHRLQGFNKLYDLHTLPTDSEWDVPADISGILSADGGNIKFD